jgi:hypothetical protein
MRFRALQEFLAGRMAMAVLFVVALFIMLAGLNMVLVIRVSPLVGFLTIVLGAVAVAIGAVMAAKCHRT